MKCKSIPFNRIWTLLTLMIGLAVVMPLSAYASTPSAGTTVEYYGRYALSLESDADGLLYVYDQLVSGVENSADEISVYDGKHPISAETLQTVFDAYTRDHPEHFWLGNTYEYMYNSSTVLSVKPSYLFVGSQLSSAKTAYERAVDQLLAGIDDSMSDFQKELLLHDRLARSIVYTDASNAHNSYGAIVEGKAVCEGYAEAFQYLLQRVGIQSFIAIGAGINPHDGSTEAHAWNYVRIDGNYYQTDLTWNDQGDTIYHAYFNLSDSMMSEDHLTASTEYRLPACHSDSAHYFSVMDGKLSGTAYSVDTIAERLKSGGMRTNVYITGSVNGFINWMKNNISDIAGKAGVRGGFSYSYQYLGRELFLTITANCKHDSLTFVPLRSATCTSDGNQAYYICDCGKWFSDQGAVSEITNFNSVIIPARGHDYSEIIDDKAHFRASAEDCRSYDTYWYDCTRCSGNAKSDPTATVKYYFSTIRGNHDFTEKCADTAHLVAGTGIDCKHAKQFYYDCAHCDRVSATIWISDIYGDHQLSDEWYSDGSSHFHKCTVSGCTYVSNKSACDGGTATCLEKAVCRTCGNAYGSLAAHRYDSKWKSDQASHWRACVCGDRTDHQLHADHSNDGKCDACGYTVSESPAITAPPAVTTVPDVTNKPEVSTVPDLTTQPTVTTTAPDETSTSLSQTAPQGSTPSDDANMPSHSESDGNSPLVMLIVIAALAGIGGTVIVAVILTARTKKTR